MSFEILLMHDTISRLVSTAFRYWLLKLSRYSLQQQNPYYYKRVESQRTESTLYLGSCCKVPNITTVTASNWVVYRVFSMHVHRSCFSICIERNTVCSKIQHFSLHGMKSWAILKINCAEKVKSRDLYLLFSIADDRIWSVRWEVRVTVGYEALFDFESGPDFTITFFKFFLN